MKKVRELVEGSWVEVTNGLEMWESIRAGIVNAADVTLGWEERKQPDWFSVIKSDLYHSRFAGVSI